MKRKYTKLLMTLGLTLTTMVSEEVIAATTLSISQTPLTLVTPSRPQVLIAIGNSESMDGTLSGAIMTGSGAIGSTITSLNNSSSPVNYVVPAGFTPPLQAANSSGLAPYTVNIRGILYDNGASRLNVAKAGIQAIIESYIQTTDFALADYTTTGNALYTTWVYYMSPQTGNFTFTNTQVTGNRYIINPCYLYPSASSTVRSNCTAIASLYGSSGPTLVSSSQYMQIGASSDDPNINDVLYAGTNLSSVFVTYNGPTPATPYPPNFTLTNYNNNGVFLRYRNTSPNTGAFGTSPTNAGFVPFSPQVMYAQRGFGYGGGQSATSGDILVPMTNLGSAPSAGSLTTAINLFTSFLKPETNRTSTTEIKAVAGQSPVAGLLSRALSYLNGLTSSGTCPPKRYVILISDGLPTLDLNGKSWPPLGSAAAQGYGVTATFNSDGSLNTTNNRALTDTITVLTNLRRAGIKTYIIGLGAGVNPAINPQAADTLTAMAIAGGTVDYYPATDPDSLVNNLNNILLAVQNGSLTTSSAAVNSTSLQAGAIEYQGSFTSGDTPYLDWTGNLIAKALDPSTGSPAGSNLWSSQPLLDAKVLGTGWSTNRFIATWNPTLNSGAGDGIPFVWTSLSTAQKASLQPSDTQGQNRVQYLRGNTALEVRNGGTFRNRSHILGDIVDSAPLYVGTPSGPYFSIASYASFVQAQSTRAPRVYVGGNDGMLHAFNALNGAEQFAFIPNAVIGNLDNLTATTYNQSHLFFVNGSPQSGDVQFADGTWHTLLVGGEGAGGNSIYAMDITNPGTLNNETNVASAVLWEFTDGDMGLSYSTPQIAPINPSTTTTQNFAVFFGNGYNSPTNKAVFYAVNPKTGAIIRKIDLCAAVSGACNANLPQGLSTVSVGNSDGLQGQSVTNVYAGDLQGNLWSINVSSSTPASWTARILFKARDSSGNIQSITTPPVVTLHPIFPRLQGLFVMFGTGEFLTVSDLTDTQTQTVYGVWDKPASNITYTRTNLQAQTLSLVLASTSGLPKDILLNSNNAVSWVITVGWFADLIIPGQRVVTEPQILNGAFLTTLITPPINLCNNTFSSMLLELNFLTGGAFYRPQLDISGNGIINVSDMYQGSYAVGISLSNTSYISAPAILYGTNAQGNKVKLFTHSGGQQTTEINPNTSPRMVSWWQIQ